MTHVDALYDTLVRNPEDSCKHNIMERVGFDEQTLDNAKRRLRTIFQADDISLVFDNWSGCGRKHCNAAFYLVGTFDGAVTHLTHGVRTVEGGIEANLRILDPLKKDLPRTLEERKAVLMHKALARLVEDISDLDFL